MEEMLELDERSAKGKLTSDMSATARWRSAKARWKEC